MVYKRPLWILCLALFGTPMADAATYYVRNAGDDTATGLSHDDAWASLGRIRKQSFAPGDSVLLYEGNRWEEQLVVNWSGSAQQPAIIGAYHLEHGVPTPLPSGELTRPVIDGTDSIPQAYDGLVRVRGDYVRLENLEVINSEGRAIQFEDVDYGQVVNCVTRNSYKSGIKFVNADHAYIYGNTVTRAGLAGPEDGQPWGGAIELVSSDSGSVIRNTVVEVYGEGINANYGSSQTLIEENLVYAARAVGIYLDAAPDAIVRRNLVLGTTNAEFWRGSQSVGAGIALNNEEYRSEPAPDAQATDAQTRNARVYANLVAFTSSGVAFWGQLAESSFDNVLVFNNTLVDNNTQVTLGQKPKPGAEFLNNIALSLSPGTRDVDTTELAGMVARNNYFSQGDPGGGFSHAGNRYDGLTLGRMSGWRSIGGANYLTWRDFAIGPGSSVIGAGDDEPLRMSQSDNTMALDFNGRPHNSPMDMGALRFSSVTISTPNSPTDMTGTPH